MSLEDYLTLQQVCQYTGKAETTIKYHVCQGHFPSAIKLGDHPNSRILIHWDDVKDWTPDRPGRKPIARPKKEKDDQA